MWSSDLCVPSEEKIEFCNWMTSMVTLNEKIEANADLTLWCVHVLGPDDVLAAPCHEAAEVRARILNRAAHDHAKAHEFADILCFAYAAPWPHSKESHAENVRDWLKDV